VNTLLTALLLAVVAGNHPVPDPLLHVASPDWRDQVIYFALIDRFDDGDPSNNDQGAGVYDPDDHRRYSGGDLAGLARRLDYLQALGATALWITPPVANQWWNGRYGGYHGYWARDFTAVDPHYGSLDDYRALSDRLHRAGMYLVQDVVFNHTGDYFGYDGHDPTDPAAGWRPTPGSVPVTAPTQWPFSLNDPRDPAQRQANIYHWTPELADHGDRDQELHHQLMGLDDLATGNAVVRRALRRSYAHWITEVGVDAFRVDTALHMAPDDLRDLFHNDDADVPGLQAVARATGREGFMAFGEGFAIDPPFGEAQARRIEGYVTDAQGRPVLDAMINFPLYGALNDVFARGSPPAELADRIQRMMRVHADPHRMPTFVDNHDVDRFLAHGDETGLRQALLALMTLPGIPVVYYGTEQGFDQRRASMFAAGWGSGGRDHFDTAHPMFGYTAALIALRLGNRAFTRGTPWPLHADSRGPGLLVWRMDHAGEAWLVAINTADSERAARMPSGLAPGTVLEARLDVLPPSDAPTVDAQGALEVVLPPRGSAVWQARGDAHAPAAQALEPLRLAPR